MAAVQGLRLIKTGEISLPAEPQRAARLRARLLAPQPTLERRIEKANPTPQRDVFQGVWAEPLGAARQRTSYSCRKLTEVGGERAY
ncbi:hypothetical protein AOLI_G00296720 [Acnodon oligacanthus]